MLQLHTSKNIKIVPHNYEFKKNNISAKNLFSPNQMSNRKLDNILKNDSDYLTKRKIKLSVS